MVSRLPLRGLDTAAAVADEALIYDPVADEVVFGTVVRSIVQGANITVDDTDPANPIVAASSGGGGGAGGVLAYKAYSAGTSATNSTTTLTDVDATNLAVTFTAPTSGKVLIRLTAVCGGSGTQGIYWGLRDGTTTIANNLLRTTVANDISSLAIPITGLTPGNVYTYKWAHRVGGVSTSITTYFGTSSTIAVMEAHALP